MKTRLIRASDRHAIKRWLKLKTEEPNMPTLTWVVPGVAAMGLRLIDTEYGLIDSMITNSLCTSQCRHNALEALYKQALEYADNLGLSGVFGFTVHADALERAKLHGFKALPHTVLVRAGDK